MDLDDLTANAAGCADRMRDAGVPLDRLAAGQSPSALFITCSDSRVVPALITEALPGELFELRTAGNIVPAYHPGRASGELATIEYAVAALEVPDIVVCGHSHCGAVSAMAGGDLDRLPVMRRWLAGHRRAVADAPESERDDPTLRPLVERHVLAQVRSLRRFPPVAARLAAGRLRLHAWFYRVDTGAVHVHGDAGFRPA